MAGTIWNSSPEESDEEIDFFYIHAIREAYQW